MLGASRAVAGSGFRLNPIVPFVLGCGALDLNFGDGVDLKIGNLLVCAGAFLAIILAYYFKKITYRFMLPDYIYAIYVLYALFSAFWSPSATDTLVQVTFLIVIWFATIALGAFQISDFCKTVVWLALGVAVLSFAAAVVSPSYAYQPYASGPLPELRGILVHQLRLGLLEGIALGILALAWLNNETTLIFKNRTLFYGASVIIALATVLAFARLYTFAMVMALLLTVGVSKPGWVRVLSWASLILLVAAIMNNVDLVLGQLVDEGVDISLTGRVLIWTRALKLAELAPLWGHGYASFDNQVFDWIFAGQYRPPHAHNSYIQAYMETGIPGLVLTILFAGSQLITASRSGNWTRRYSYSLFMVFYCILGSLTGANYAAKPSALLALTMLAVSVEGRRKRRSFATDEALRSKDNSLDFLRPDGVPNQIIGT